MTWLATASLAHAFLKFCENIMPQCFCWKCLLPPLFLLLNTGVLKNQRPKGFLKDLKPSSQFYCDVSVVTIPAQLPQDLSPESFYMNFVCLF